MARGQYEPGADILSPDADLRVNHDGTVSIRKYCQYTSHIDAVRLSQDEVVALLTSLQKRLNSPEAKTESRAEETQNSDAEGDAGYYIPYQDLPLSFYTPDEE